MPSSKAVRPPSTAELAHYIATLTFAELPGDVIELAKLCVLDTVGVAIAARAREWADIARAHALAGGGPRDSGIWGTRDRVAAAAAAFANATAAHGIEMDDRIPSAQNHPGSIAVPVACALAERHGRRGAEFLAAVVAGYEAGTRVGRAVTVRSPGIHPPGHKGVWVAAGSAVNAAGLAGPPALNAFGLCGSLAGGISEFTQDQRGTMVKRMHAGFAAQHGITAADLAARGATAPATVLEGRYGYCSVFAAAGQEPRLDELTSGLGERFLIREREVKPYASWGGGHTIIEAVDRLRSHAGIDPSGVRSVVVAGSARLIEGHQSPRPESVMAGQYSIPFLVATALRFGAAAFANPDLTWTDEALRDPATLRLAGLVEMEHDAGAQRRADQARHYGGVRVEVRTVDGSAHTETVLHSKGTRENPMSRADITGKFRSLAAPVLGEDRAAELLAAVLGLDEAPNVLGLLDLMGEAA